MSKKNLIILLLAAFSGAHSQIANVNAQPKSDTYAHTTTRIDAHAATGINAHPSLWVNASQIEAIRKGIKDTTLKLAGWLRLKEIAGQFLAQPVEIPPRGGNWEEFYISPVTGNPLTRGPQVGDWKWKHIDRKAHTEFLGDSTDTEKDYDGVVIGLIHNNWALGLVQLGLAYQLSGDTAYLNKARQILLGYAALYPTLPVRTRQTRRLSAQGSGKIHVQDLNESQWLVDMAEGADLIWDQLSFREQTLVTNQLLLPAAEVVMHRRPDTTNIQCWRNAAVGSVGFLTNNDRLIALAMGDTTGFNAQVKEGFNTEGMTKDLSPGYQFFTLYPLIVLAQSAYNHGYPVDLAPLHKMFSLPLEMSNPQLMLPPFNDSKPVQLTNEAYLYEWAYTEFHDSTFMGILFNAKRSFFNFDLGPQFIGWNLLFGTANFQIAAPRPVESRKFDSSGVILLSKGEGHANLSCYVKYTNQMKNLRHFHNAQLDMAIIKDNEYVTVIPGNANYASPLSDGWYRSGVAHNTLVFNQRPQRRSSAKCLGFGKDNGIDYAVTSSTNLFNKSGRFVRTTAVLNEDQVLVIDQFRAAKPEPAIFDLCYHPGGVWQDRVKGEPWVAPDSNGYRYLVNPTINKQQQSFFLTTKLASGRSVTTGGAASVPMDLITSDGQSILSKSGPAVLFRCHTDSTETVTVAYCISSNGARVKIILEPATNPNKKSFLAALVLEDEKGVRTRIVVNPDGEVLPGSDNTVPAVFAVSH